MSLRAALILLSISAGLRAQTLDALVRAARTKPQPGDLAAIQRMAAAHPNDQTGALALLSLGILQWERQSAPEALQSLQAADKRLPQLSDYVAYYRQAAEHSLGQYSESEREWNVIAKTQPASPLVSRAVIAAAKSQLAAQKPGDAVALLTKQFASGSDPRTSLLLGNAYEAQKDLRTAAVYYQQVYYGFPVSPEAADAERLLTAIAAQQALPAPGRQQTLSRAYTLLDKGEPIRAKQDLNFLLPYLDGVDKELAQVRVGVAEYQLKDTAASLRTLGALHPTTPEVDAERLYYLHAGSLRLDRDADAGQYLDQLSRTYPQSAWRLKALVAMGNNLLRTNEIARYEPIFRACADASPQDPQAADCHWKALWPHYLQNQPDATELLKAHLTRFPRSEKASAALYYLGRTAERERQPGAARLYYQEILQRFPNSYYATLAGPLLQDAKITSASVPSNAVDFLASVRFAGRPSRPSFNPTAVTTTRIARGRLLATAGLDDLAEGEFRFGATTDGQPHIMALELAQNCVRRGAADQGIRYIKRYAPDYLNYTLDELPRSFWQFAFPLPFREELEAHSRERSIDPFLVAALVRQESEFNPTVVSRANAFGLTQVLPSTGRELTRRLGLGRFNSSMLFNPSFNLNLGTYYLRMLVTSLEGRWEAALASYNAGKTRAVRWLGWSQYREPAEFVENIPFTETRNYVQIVLRNADVYRRLYGSKPSLVPSADGNNRD